MESNALVFTLTAKAGSKRDNILQKWGKREGSLFCMICGIETYALSKIIYLATVRDVLDDIRKQIKELMFPFI